MNLKPWDDYLFGPEWYTHNTYCLSYSKSLAFDMTNHMELTNFLNRRFIGEGFTFYLFFSNVESIAWVFASVFQAPGGGVKTNVERVSSCAPLVSALRTVAIMNAPMTQEASNNNCNNTMQHYATPCNTMQHHATLCNAMQHHATPCNTMQHHATPCNTMQHYATPCNAMQHHATLCNAMQHHATPCNTMQHYATPCNTMQRHATPCNTMQHHATPFNTTDRGDGQETHPIPQDQGHLVHLHVHACLRLLHLHQHTHLLLRGRRPLLQQHLEHSRPSGLLLRRHAQHPRRRRPPGHGTRLRDLFTRHWKPSDALLHQWS